MKKLNFKILLALFVSCLFLGGVLAQPAFAVAPPDTGGDDTGGDDTGGDGQDGDGEYQLTDEERQSFEDANRTYDQDGSETETADSIQERANVAENASNCEGLPETFVRHVRTGGGAGRATGELHCTRIVDADTGECGSNCTYSRRWSCFPPETQITMGDGSTKQIKMIRRGDLVWNPALKKAVKVTETISGPETKPLRKVGYEGATVQVTQTHPMVIQKRAAGFSPVALRNAESTSSQIVKASELTKNDRVLGANGEFHQITVLEDMPVVPNQAVYNFELEADSDAVEKHLIVADGVITGDVRVQANLNDYRLPWDTK